MAIDASIDAAGASAIVLAIDAFVDAAVATTVQWMRRLTTADATVK